MMEFKARHSKNMIKILMFTSYFPPHIGGSEKNVYRLSLELNKKGYQVEVVTCNINGHKSFEIIENIKGTRGATYYYVLDGNVLKHISKYATSSRRFYNEVEYLVDISRLKGKYIIEFGFSNRGHLYITKYPAEDLVKNFSLRRRESLRAEDLLSLTIFDVDKEVRHLLNEWKEVYTLMINEVREFEAKYGLSINVSGPRVYHMMNDPALFLIETIIMPYKKQKIRSLVNTMKQIHQIWVTLQLIEAFTPRKVNGNFWFKQSSSHSIAIVESSYGDVYSVWYSIDNTRYYMLKK